jgi:hypothetical protein
VILPGIVITSGRNLRSHSSFEVLRIVAGFAPRGPVFFRSRHGPWYGLRLGELHEQPVLAVISPRKRHRLFDISHARGKLHSELI